MKSLSTVPAVLLWLVTPAMAATDISTAVRQCFEITDQTKRHQCLDAIALKDSASEGKKITTATANLGKWEISTLTDPATKQPTFVATLNAKTGAFGSSTRHPSMTVLCRNKQTEMYIDWHQFLNLSPMSVLYRVNQDAAQQSDWNVSTDKEAVFFPDSPIATLKQIAKGKTFIVSLTPFDEKTVTAVFDVAGADQAFYAIRQACQW